MQRPAAHLASEVGNRQRIPVASPDQSAIPVVSRGTTAVRSLWACQCWLLARLTHWCLQAQREVINGKLPPRRERHHVEHATALSTSAHHHVEHAHQTHPAQPEPPTTRHDTAQTHTGTAASARRAAAGRRAWTPRGRSRRSSRRRRSHRALSHQQSTRITRNSRTQRIEGAD